VFEEIGRCATPKVTKFPQLDLSGVSSNHHLRSGITRTSSRRDQLEGGVKRGLPDHEAKDLGGEAPTGFDNKSNGIVDDANPPGRSRSIGPP